MLARSSRTRLPHRPRGIAASSARTLRAAAARRGEARRGGRLCKNSPVHGAERERETLGEPLAAPRRKTRAEQSRRGRLLLLSPEQPGCTVGRSVGRSIVRLSVRPSVQLSAPEICKIQSWKSACLPPAEWSGARASRVESSRAERAFVWEASIAGAGGDVLFPVTLQDSGRAPRVRGACLLACSPARYLLESTLDPRRE